jgi:hypothetical protein
MAALPLLLFSLVVQAAPGPGARPPDDGRPPLIATGWDSPTPRQYREGLAAFEQWGVFDGSTLRATRRTKDGNEKDARYAFSREPWQWEEFSEALKDLKAAQPKTCRETFLMLYANPGDVDWFDDRGWQEIVNHWRLLSRLARQGGLRGLLYDAEPYEKPHSQFLYRAQAERDRHSFAEYLVEARRRGREVLDAVRQEFPEATIFTYRLFSDMLGLLESGDLNRALEADTYGLQPAFVDGWLDVMPPGIKVIEGTEDIGYRANSSAEYNAAFTRLRLRLPAFLAPEHREQTTRRFRIGQSLYLDAYVNPPGNPWHIERAGTTAAARLAANASSALAASDGVVWLYGEQARWWPTADGKQATWPDKLPGALAALRRAKDPSGFARDQFRLQPPPKNLIENGDFSRSTAPDAPPAGWFVWQAETSQGRLACAEGRVELRGMLEGVVGRAVEVQPGRTVALRLRLKSEGRGVASLSVGWKSAAGQWTAQAANRRFSPGGPVDADGWRDVHALVEVPAGARQLMFMAAVAGQLGEADRCWFDDAALTEIPD